jgi:hypothetical protein
MFLLIMEAPSKKEESGCQNTMVDIIFHCTIVKNYLSVSLEFDKPTPPDRISSVVRHCARDDVIMNNGLYLSSDVLTFGSVMEINEVLVEGNNWNMLSYAIIVKGKFVVNES